MKRFIALLIALFILAGMFTGCGQKAGESAADTSAEVTKEESTTVESIAVESVYPFTVKDANGFEMTIEKEPVNIVSLTLGTDEMLLGDDTVPGLIDKTRIKALTQYADDIGISDVAGAAKGVADRVTWDSTEKIIALGPDLVLADTWADPKSVQQLRDAGITVYVFKTPNNIEAQKNTVLEIAHVVGADSEGKKMVDWMNEKLKSVEDKLKALKEEQKLSVMDYGEMGSSGIGTNFDDIVTKAGLTNAVAKAGFEGWNQVSKEKIIEMNPDIMILPSWYYDKKNSLQGMIDTLKSDKSLVDVKAVKNDRLISVPNPHVSAISQYVVLGVEDIAKAAYPDLFK